METTRFEITMIVDVVDVGDVQASSGALHDSIIKAVEGISTGDVVAIIEAHTLQKTFPKKVLPRTSAFCDQNKPIFLEQNAGLDANLATKATEGYMCDCGALVEKGTELHLCQKCHTKQCPNCFDYNNAFCEECDSK